MLIAGHITEVLAIIVPMLVGEAISVSGDYVTKFQFQNMTISVNSIYFQGFWGVKCLLGERELRFRMHMYVAFIILLIL